MKKLGVFLLFLVIAVNIYTTTTHEERQSFVEKEEMIRPLKIISEISDILAERRRENLLCWGIIKSVKGQSKNSDTTAPQELCPTTLDV